MLTSRAFLVEQEVRDFFIQTLNKCHRMRQMYYNNIFNIVVFVLFCIVFTLVLMYKYRGKADPEELERRSYEKKMYILSKIQHIQQSTQRERQELITGLPHWEDEYK